MTLHFKLAMDYYAGGLLHILLKPVTIILGKVLRRNHDTQRCSTITFIKLLGGGSLVIAYPSLLGLKRAPHIRSLRLVTTPAVKQFAETLGVFDEIVVIRDHSVIALTMDAVKTLIRLFRCEAIVDFEVHSRLTTVFALLTCAQNRVGFYTTASFWRRDIATHLLFYHPANGVYEFYDQVTRLFGGITVPFENASAAFLARMGVVPARDPECTRIGVAPGCSDLSKERMLEFADWATVLARQLERVPPGQKAEVHLLGGPGDQETTARIGTALRQEYADVPVFDHAGKLSMQDSVRQLATLTTVVCIDSALQHFARLLGLSVVSFWGPTDPSVLLRPRRGNRDEVNYYKLSCSPCVHMAHQPPCKGNNICMGYAVDPSRAGERNPIWLAQTTRTSQR